MAQRVQVLLTDDLDGTEADETISFSLDGIAFEIDLSGPNAESLRETLTPYVEAARRVGGRGRLAVAKTKRSQPEHDLAAVREWARENGYQVSDRGRMSGEVMEAYANRSKAVKPSEPAVSDEGGTVTEIKKPARKRAPKPEAEFSAALTTS